jgi:carbon storage regulator
MLVLSRRIGETVIIGGEVRVTVLRIRGTQARLGIDAPENVSVHREEVHRSMHLADEEDDDQ